MTRIEGWLPPGKIGAVCFTIDDVHPGRSTDCYEAGGDLGRGALGHVEWLLERHAELRVTLFTTADWREMSPVPTRKLLSRLPVVRDRVFLTPVLPTGTMRLDRHPEFVRYLKGLPRTEVALHGLHHVHRGLKVPIEFQDEHAESCARILEKARSIFAAAGLPPPAGMTPPGWNAPPALLDAMVRVGLSYLASARDIRSRVEIDAKASMSGLQGVALFQPELVERERLVHLPSNFQATSDPSRATDVVKAGGLLSIKAHIVKNAMGHVALDGMDVVYRNYLDSLFSTLEAKFGGGIWWATMAEVAARAHAVARRVEGTAA